MSGAQIQMISVGEDDFRVQAADEIPRQDALHGRLGAHRHEYRSFNIAVSGVKDSRARARLRADRLKLESKQRL